VRLEREVHWPCGFHRRDAVRTWRWSQQCPIPAECPLHGLHCPVPMDAPIRRKLRELRKEMYELDTDTLWERLENLVFDALGPPEPIPAPDEEAGGEGFQ
jgi:hypothetical protein